MRAAGAFAIACAALAACELGEDTRLCLNRPVLSGFEIIPEQIYASWPDTVRFIIEASDVSAVDVTVESPGGLQQSCAAQDPVEGLRRCKMWLPEPPESGTWTVTQVFLDDTGVAEFCAGTAVSGAQLEQAGYPASFVVIE